MPNSPLIIAELSGNHGGSLDKALRMVDQSADAGADMVKIQTYKPETMTVKGLDTRFEISSGLWRGYRLHDLYESAMTPWDWHKKLSERALANGISLFSSPFDETAVQFLEDEINPPLYKIASFELNHFPLLRAVAQTRKPVIASTGVSSEKMIKQALDCLREEGCPSVTLLHCVSEYPANPEDFCLHEMPNLKRLFDTDFGLSDHSSGHLIAVAATSLGAGVIEKHFSLDREVESIDGAFSMLPEEFKEMVHAVRLTKVALGQVGREKKISAEAAFFKRSILVSQLVHVGETLSVKNLRIARPGDGLCPSKWDSVLGKKAVRTLPVGHPLSTHDFK